MKICAKCSKFYDDTWGICLYCNSSLEYHEGEPPNKISNEKEESFLKQMVKVFLVGTTIIAVLMLILFGLCSTVCKIR